MMVDFKFDAIQVSLHREPSEVGLVEKLTGNLLVDGAVRANPTERVLPHSLIYYIYCIYIYLYDCRQKQVQQTSISAAAPPNSKSNSPDFQT